MGLSKLTTTLSYNPEIEVKVCYIYHPACPQFSDCPASEAKIEFHSIESTETGESLYHRMSEEQLNEVEIMCLEEQCQ